MSFIGRGGQCSVVARWGFEDFYSWTFTFLHYFASGCADLSSENLNRLKEGAAARF
jgi:hypothetical protein